MFFHHGRTALGAALLASVASLASAQQGVAPAQNSPSGQPSRFDQTRTNQPDNRATNNAAQPGTAAQPGVRVQPGAVQPGVILQPNVQPGVVVQPNSTQIRVVEGQPAVHAAGQMSGQHQSADQQIAACLLTCNEEEVALGKFAQERSQNNEVKQFAQQMVEEHSAMVAKLQPLAPQNLRPIRASANAEHSAAAQQTSSAPAQPLYSDPNSARDPNAAQASMQRHLDWTSIHREMAERCLQSTMREFEKHQGAAFDQAYLGQQLMMHLAMNDKLQVLKNHASGQLQTIIVEAIASTQKHTEHVRSLMERISKKEVAAAPESDLNR